MRDCVLLISWRVGGTQEIRSHELVLDPEILLPGGNIVSNMRSVWIINTGILFLRLLKPYSLMNSMIIKLD